MKGINGSGGDMPPAMGAFFLVLALMVIVGVAGLLTSNLILIIATIVLFIVALVLLIRG